MYAVSLDGVGIIAGTMAYSRRAAIVQFNGEFPGQWEECKRAGYRTVQATVEWIDRWGQRHRRANAR